jgi:hypothetical protein
MYNNPEEGDRKETDGEKSWMAIEEWNIKWRTGKWINRGIVGNAEREEETSIQYDGVHSRRFQGRKINL